MTTQPPDRVARESALLAALEQRILVLDGATGTAFQAANLGPADFGGEELEGCNEILVDTRPDVVLDVHRAYLRAGADIVETNTFGGTPLVLGEYGLQERALELNRRAAELARQACDEEGPERFVCGSMGPTTKAISVTGGVTFEQLRDDYLTQALGLAAGGADYLLLETCQDTRNVKAGLIGIEEAFRRLGWRLPVAVSVTIETMGTMLGGQEVEALAASLLHRDRRDLLYVGLNCATGPDQMFDHLRALSEICRTRVACVPNAGLPDEDGLYTQTPDDFRAVFSRFLEHGWLNLVGGCCGTTSAHIEAFADLVRGRSPRRPADHRRCLVSGLDVTELSEDNRPLLVGERTNVLGSRKFKRLIKEGEYEAAAEVGRAQVRGGAQVVDICLQDPERDETDDMERFLERLVRRVKVPLMIDSTDHEVMARALTWCQGRSILNSINLEDGLERFERVVPLAQEFGCSLVVGLIDEEGMAVSVERKLEVAARSHELLTSRWGIEPQEIWWDPLVFPCGTGDEAYLGSAAATIEGVRRVREAFPGTRTILGISNVSFGLPLAGREVLNAVFLYRCTVAGLDAAIVNTQGLARYAEIPAAERVLAEALLDLRPGDVEAGQRAVEAFTAAFRERKGWQEKAPRDLLPLPERLSRSVVEGSKEGLRPDLDAALADPRWPDPLDIINGPLMTGMAEVGRLFNNNELIVAEVLQSAEVMKAAVDHLEPHMERMEGMTRGRVILATVKGDVHDIGKNLVDIILTNNGFEVVNLGIKVPSEQLIQAARKHEPDVIGLSGLLVKSAQQMVATAGDLRDAGIETDLVVGGAALTRRFTHNRIAPEYGGVCTYAGDAMSGLDLIERLCDGGRRSEQLDRIDALRVRDSAPVRTGPRGAKASPGDRRSRAVGTNVPAPQPPDLERHTARFDLDDVWPHLNLQMLYAKHLGLKGSVERLRAADDPKLLKVEAVVEELKEFARGELAAHGVWRFFPARSEGNRLVLLEPGEGGEKVAAEWLLPRQPREDGLCLADYVLPRGDHVALFVVTAGAGVREAAERFKARGEYLKSHAYAALALETAEAAAELLHQRLRAELGFADPPEMTTRERLAAKYRGKRYSFGYPACPDLAGQRQLFAALEPADIGVELTEGDMMDPEATVSALVFHHPDARYFGV
ncbi:MAG: methionine synthase [Holophagales bacterium]|nr:methionine synthase [Holophagales bacterium]MYC11522.1 methionine synthase [Holophagales bacterium]